jgi:hypothetical protein
MRVRLFVMLLPLALPKLDAQGRMLGPPVAPWAFWIANAAAAILAAEVAVSRC